MSRTTRNRKSIPHDWTVRDNGRPYRNGNGLFGNDLFEKQGYVHKPRYRRHWSRCEITKNRRIHYQQYRARTNHLVRTGRWEDILPPKRTEGRLTW